MAIDVARRTRFLTWLAVLCGVAACSSPTVGGPLSMSLSSESDTVTAGVKLTVNYAATGSYLTGILVEYGDGLVDSIPTYGAAQSASGRLQHAWDSAGDYTVVGTVFDGSKGNLSKELMVHVTAAPGS